MAILPKYLLLLLMVLIEGIPFHNFPLSEMNFPQNVMLEKHKGKFKAETSLFFHFHLDSSPLSENKINSF